MDHVLKRHRLGAGVICSKEGLLVGGVPLLEKRGATWTPRQLDELNRDLSALYGLPVDCAGKRAGLIATSRALNEGEVAKAQIVTLHLRLPYPPHLAKGARLKAAEIALIARELQQSGLLKAGWDASLHPRWPAGSPDSTGGQFAPGGAVGGSGSTGPSSGGPGTTVSDSPGARLINAQLLEPFEELAPLVRPIPPPAPSGAIPYPPPPPIIGPIPTNPYRDRPECVKQWEDAKKFCEDLEDRKLLGKGDYSYLGRTVGECMRGRVSESCGGNPVV